MIKGMKQPLGYFEATYSGGVMEIVIVSQEMLLDGENVVVAARRVFTLGTIDGEEIFLTTDGQAFHKKDGTRIRKVGNCQDHGSVRGRILS